jgi:hypothetical protein
MNSSVFGDTMPYGSLKVNCFGREDVTPIFQVKDEAMQETRVKQVASRALLNSSGQTMFRLRLQLCTFFKAY